MDDIVTKSLKKWPNVPHCYHWLALDRRGQWRMRDEAAQQNNDPGNVIRHDALNEFTGRNYTCDARRNDGTLQAWYFQNGPQRVYVDLELTPFVARIYPDRQIRLMTGAHLPDQAIDQLWLNADGDLILGASLPGYPAPIVALIDDRDLALAMEHLMHRASATSGELVLANETQLEAAMQGDTTQLCWQWNERIIPLDYCQSAQLPLHYGYLLKPDSKDLPL